MELANVKGIGEKTLLNLHDHNIYTVDDLIYYFPLKYDVFEVNNDEAFSACDVSIKGTLESKPYFIKYRRNVNACIFYLMIDNKKVKCVVFSSDYLRYKLIKGITIIAFGRYKALNNEFVVKSIFFDDFSLKIQTDYKIKEIPNSTIKKAIQNIFSSGYKSIDYMPNELLLKYKLLDIDSYLYKSHFPETKQDYIEVIRRRKYEEFFWYSISLELLKTTRKNGLKVKRSFDDKIINNFIKSLPYELTSDQLKAIDIIKNDILSDKSMNRLIQGDVGCGKSIVAYISSLMEVLSGYQVAIMVPTEILASEQYKKLKEYLKPFELNIQLLTSSIKKSEKEDILYKLQNNRINILIGTHALIEENVKFYKLGLIIIDEQHKFGVIQRKKLYDKFKNVDAMYLSATPIPRTLGLTYFGDLDITSIYSKPKNRANIKTLLYDYSGLDEIVKIINKHINLGEQAYIVVPLVEESDSLDLVDINKAYSYFSEKLNGLVSLVHGKMKSIDKVKAMDDFHHKRTNVLISTTVIEVGVDVKDATIMVILDADRFGLAQIHQLRGRVGRGTTDSCCILVSKDINNERLNVIKETTDGFSVAEHDLRLRGPGNYLGEEQSGYVELPFVDFKNDFNIFKCAKEDASIYIDKFMKEKNNLKFLSLFNSNKNQKGKIN